VGVIAWTASGAVRKAEVRVGEGTPANNVAAPVGTLFLRTDGGEDTTLYVKEAGTDANGWAAK